MHGLIHARHRNMPKVFEGRSSRIYDFMSRRVLRGMYRRLAADVAAVAPDGAAVLDVGTGPGVLLVDLATRRPDLRVTGVDLSADMITAATRNLERFGERAHALVGDVTSLPFPDRSFDLIVSSLSLHHWDHPEAAVPELARVLRPGGQVYIYDFPFAPFDKLADAARAGSVLNGQSHARTRIRTGIPFLRCVRYVMSA
ncbi:MAG TPA: class I SAM-dependent methyltransferase [Pilimelia sp.]|nr:class I SAM-dependent methyltransferase [Pilimelia sp.]